MQRSVDLPSQYATFRNPSESQRCAGRHWWEWTLLIVTLMNVGSLLGLSAVSITYAVQEHQDIPQQAVIIGTLPIPLIDAPEIDPSFTFDLVMIISSVFVAATVLYGLFGEKKYDLVICPLMFITAVAFCIVEYSATTASGDKNVKMARIIVCCVLSLLSIPLTVRTVNEEYWTEYQITGASDGLMGMYRRLRYFNALLKLDMFFVVLLGTFSLYYSLDSTTMQWGFFCFFILYAPLCLSVGSFAVNLELKYLVFTFVVLTVFLPLIVPFQIITSYCFGLPDPLQCAEAIRLVAGCAIATAILSITLRTYILLVLLQVYRHFGYGLTDAAFAGLIANESTSLLGRQRRLY